MRITKEKVAENRTRVLNSAAALFRERGFDGIGVADLMRSAGMTHGGFYNHFASKEELEIEACRHIFAHVLSLLEPIGRIEDPLERKAARDAYFDRYLSIESRDRPFHSCPLVAFGADIARKSPWVQAAFAEGLERYIEAMQRAYGLCADDESARQLVLRNISRLVGAASLARSCRGSHPAMSEAILAATLADLTKAPELASASRA